MEELRGGLEPWPERFRTQMPASAERQATTVSTGREVVEPAPEFLSQFSVAHTHSEMITAGNMSAKSMNAGVQLGSHVWFCTRLSLEKSNFRRLARAPKPVSENPVCLDLASAGALGQTPELSIEWDCLERPSRSDLSRTSPGMSDRSSYRRLNPRSLYRGILSSCHPCPGPATSVPRPK